MKAKAIGKPGISPWSEAICFDANIGWRGVRDQELFLQAEEVFGVEMGPDGWRGSRPIEAADVVVFGD